LRRSIVGANLLGKTISIQAKGRSDVGSVRQNNQDSFLIDQSEHLYIVADGMGGHAGGEIASQLCTKEIVAHLRKNGDLLRPGAVKHPDARIGSVLGQAVNHSSTRIYERALEEPALRGMGTTATLLKIIDDYAYYAHVGDSRLYLLRCNFIYQMTNDHSLVSEQVRAGILTKEEAELHHLRNVITRSVGYQEEEDVDTASFALEDGDVMLLCSDGLHGYVTDQEISQLVTQLGVEATDKLIDLANERGGPDNITVVILKAKV
jgi:serine/threonine protein phosphatase PrpC